MHVNNITDYTFKVGTTQNVKVELDFAEICVKYTQDVMTSKGVTQKLVWKDILLIYFIERVSNEFNNISNSCTTYHSRSNQLADAYWPQIDLN